MAKTSSSVHKTLEVRELTDSTFVIRVERKGMEFTAGQHISLGLAQSIHTREYSVYSGVHDDYLEILVKEVIGGLVSPALKKVKAGDMLSVGDAVGYFNLSEADLKKNKFLFIASGTGISPFHSFVKSHANLNYKLLHGVKYAEEAYERECYDADRLVVCTSQDKKGDYHGRVTHYLKELKDLDKESVCYLCGNCNMIHEAYDILLERGISQENIHAEVYF